jgi:hypothetical protein
MTQTIDHIYDKTVDFDPNVDLSNTQVLLQIKEVYDKIERTLSSSTNATLDNQK